MLKTVAMTLLVTGGIQVVAMAAETDQPSAAAISPAQQQAVEHAKAAVAAQFKVAVSELTVETVEPRTWNDSSLGCGKPGSMSLQVISEGYAVTLATPQRKYRVHVAEDNAAICDQPALARKEVSRSGHARGLDVMIEKARQDLAQRLGVNPTAIRLESAQPHEWPDNGLGCPRSGETIVATPVNGFKLSLKYQSRIYTYHSDLEDVRACPAIEAS